SSGLAGKRGYPGFCRTRAHPTPAGPVGELLRDFADQRLARPSFQRDFESAIFETHEPHVAFERALDREIPLLGGEADQVLETLERSNWLELCGRLDRH